MRIKLPRVHAGIGSAATRSFDFAMQNKPKRFVKGFLNAAGIGLNLPAVVATSVVLKFNEIAMRHWVQFLKITFANSIKLKTH
jgi:hypothetical protein